MKKRNDIKKEVKKIKKTEDTMVNKRRNQKKPDLWKEIRSNLKPLGKAYNKYRVKRRIAKQKEEERRLTEEEEQRLREKTALRLQDQAERRLKKKKKNKRRRRKKIKGSRRTKIGRKKDKRGSGRTNKARTNL